MIQHIHTHNRLDDPTISNSPSFFLILVKLESGQRIERLGQKSYKSFTCLIFSYDNQVCPRLEPALGEIIGNLGDKNVIFI